MSLRRRRLETHKQGEDDMKRWLTAAILLLLMAQMSYAQGLGFGPLAGYFKSADADQGEYMGGAALRLKLTKSLAVEGSIMYRQEKYGGGALTVRSWPVMATGLFYLLPPVLYGAVGAGWYNTTLDYDQSKMGGSVMVKDETTQEFGWHFGGGVEIPFGQGTHIYGDIRYVFLDYDFSQLPGSEGMNSDFYIISVGILWGM